MLHKLNKVFNKNDYLVLDWIELWKCVDFKKFLCFQNVCINLIIFNPKDSLYSFETCGKSEKDQNW